MKEIMEYFAVLTRLEQYSVSCSTSWTLIVRPDADFESATFIPNFSRKLNDILVVELGLPVSTDWPSPPPVSGAFNTSRTLGRLVRLESTLSFLSGGLSSEELILASWCRDEVSYEISSSVSPLATSSQYYDRGTKVGAVTW